MKQSLKLLLVGVVIIVLSLVFVFQKQFVSKEEAPQNVVTVRAITVEEAEYANYAEYIGVIKGDSLTKLSFQVPGKITTLHVKADALVKKGEALAEIEPNRLELGTQASQSQVLTATNQVNKAKDAYNFAKNQYDNASSLFSSGGASQNDLDKAKLSYEMAQSDLKSAEEQKRLAQVQGQQNQLNLKDATIIAPFDGYVVDWLTEVGEITAAGYPVVVYRSPGQIIEASITQKDYNAFEVGTQVEIDIDDTLLTGVITRREAYPNPETRTFNVEIAMESNDYPIGALCTIKAQTKSLTGTKLPIMALIYNEQKQVYRVDGLKVQLVDVEVLEITDDYVIVSGLKDGMSVVTEGIKRLKAGDSVVLLK
jgi:RND family efflux transporter MFP subunit